MILPLHHITTFTKTIVVPDVIMPISKLLIIHFDHLYKFLPLNIRDDIEITKLAIRKSVHNLSNSSIELRNNPEIILSTIVLDPHAIEYAGQILKDNYLFLRSALSTNGLCLKYFENSYLLDEQLCEDAVSQNGMALQWCSRFLTKNIIVKALRQNPEAIRFIILTNEISELAVKTNGETLEFLSNEQRKDEKLVTTAIRNKVKAIKFAEENIIINRELMIKLFEECDRKDKSIFITLYSSKKISYKNCRKHEEIEDSLRIIFADIFYFVTSKKGNDINFIFK